VKLVIFLLLAVLLLWAVLIHGEIADSATTVDIPQSRTPATAPASTTTTAQPPTARARTAPIVIPRRLRVIRWCEAGSYLGLPFLSTNYRAFTHGFNGSSGGYQILRSTWRSWARSSGKGFRYAAAYLAPPDVQDWVALWGFTHNGTRPWNASRSCWGSR
jgi:hypothetical protein